jgi:hypothetical protein
MNLELTFHNGTQHSCFCELDYIKAEITRIVINLPFIYKCSKKYHIPFEELYATVVSHEYLHKVIYELEDDDACVKLDNICSGKLDIFNIKAFRFGLVDQYIYRNHELRINMKHIFYILKLQVKTIFRRS